MKIYLIFLMISNFIIAQNFWTEINEIKTFDFYDKQGRNQVTFLSNAPLEDITGSANVILW